jgi:aryl carrier-like protein
MTDGTIEGTIESIASAEATLCRILAEVLELEHVRPQDGFFEVGGDSVLAVQVVARAREAGLILGVRDLFDHQTAETLAAVIGGKPASSADIAKVAEPEKAPLVAFTDDEFGDFGDLAETSASDNGAEAKWETIT